MRKQIKILLIVLNIIFISMIGLIRTADKSDSVVFSMVPALICVIVLLFGKYKLFEDRRNIKWDILLTAMFILMLSLEDILKTMRSMGAEPFNTVFKIVYFPVLIIALIIDTDYALLAAAHAGALSQTVKDKTDGRDYLGDKKFLGIYYPVWLYIGLTFVFVIAYFPGLMNSDFEKQWIWGEGPTVWSDWHTVGFLMFVKLCTAVIHKPFMITIVQVLMYYLTANYAVSVLNRNFPERRRVGWIFICVYMLFGIYSCMYMSEVRKDNCSTPMMLAFAVALLDHSMRSEHTKKEYINLGVFAFLASLFRHSLWEIVLITLMLTIVCEALDRSTDKDTKKKTVRNLCVVVATTIGAFLIVTEGIGFGILKAERNPAYVKYTIPMNLAASLAYRSRETGLYIEDDIVNKMEQIIPMEKWAEYYCPYDADTTDRPWHEIGDNVYKLNDPQVARDIIDVDMYYLTHYPKQFVISFFDVNSIVWEMAVASDLVMYSPGLATEHYEIHHMRKGEFFYFAESCKKFMSSFAVARAVVYRGGIYLFLLAMITVILIKKQRFKVLVSMMPILLYALALMISIPQEGSHYIMAFPLFAALFGVTSFMVASRESL